MTPLFRTTLALLSAALLHIPGAAAGSLVSVEDTATAMLADLGQSAIRLQVLSVRDAKSDPAIRALLGRASMPFNANSAATALYYKGQCTLMVNTSATDQPLRPDLQRLVAKEDVVFFITAHELAHCISQHRQAQELRQLAAGETLSHTFLPPAVLEQGAAGTLNAQSFAAILQSEATVQREEVFADVLASLYVRLKKGNAQGILSAIAQTRADAADQGDHVHDTAAKLQAAAAYGPAYAMADVVALSHTLRQ
jgi:hypothetical protein